MIKSIVEEVVTHGVYVFLDELADNKPYVGKSKRDLDKRIKEHAKSGSRRASLIVSKINVKGSKDDVQVIEQLIYDLLAGDNADSLSNTNRPLSKTRASKHKLRQKLATLKICSK
ncbi:GIY-YIG nuclease family protein [Rheinheimera baltica]|uniref:GIY-YIG nuclease family protein n=1 Tax=Rheinheimera baltica TaxID=67576 RepID=UPI00273D62AD|nr:GIY-YIG nuclease family protein [Rheinheimera baltica]MDP5141380.1 GIY-YIG nuclease family protein [Rheinheimera baltica]